MPKLFKKLNYLLRPGSRDHQPDYILIGSVFLLVFLGLIVLSSASSIRAYIRFDDPYHFFNRQLLAVGLGVISFFVFSRLNYRNWQDYALGFLLASIVLLVLVFIPALSADWGSSRSWISIFGFSLQPSEFVKISFLLYLAAWLDKRGKNLKDLYEGIGPFVIIIAIIGILMLLQPDFGTLFIIGFVSLVVYYVGGGSKKHVIIMIALASLAFLVMINLLPYQMERVRCMMDPSYSPDKHCFQVNQSLIAVGSGGLFGRGFGESRQKFSYIPEVHNDFIFAIIGEEMGLFISFVIILLFFIIFYRGIMIAKKAPDGYGMILATGISTWLFFQALINIGGVINLIPMTGVPLPFVSFGGSSMLTSLTAVGILVNISKQTKLR